MITAGVILRASDRHRRNSPPWGSKMKRITCTTPSHSLIPAWMDANHLHFFVKYLGGLSRNNWELNIATSRRVGKDGAEKLQILIKSKSRKSKSQIKWNNHGQSFNDDAGAVASRIRRNHGWWHIPSPIRALPHVLRCGTGCCTYHLASVHSERNAVESTKSRFPAKALAVDLSLPVQVWRREVHVGSLRLYAQDVLNGFGKDASCSLILTRYVFPCKQCDITNYSYLTTSCFSSDQVGESTQGG